MKVGVHQDSMLSPLMFAMVVDEVTENARKGWMKQILGKIMEELRENFNEWREMFESKEMRVCRGKTKSMLNGMEEETFDSRIDPL